MRPYTIRGRYGEYTEAEITAEQARLRATETDIEEEEEEE